MKTKEREGFEALFEIAKNNIARARHIAGMIPVEKLSLRVMMTFHQSKDPGVLSLSGELALKIREDNLSYYKLLDYYKSGNQHVSELSARLLLNHFSERLTLEILFDFQKSRVQATRDDAKGLAMSLPKYSISLEFLIKIMCSTAGDAFNLARDLAMTIDLELLDPKMLIEYQRVDSLPVRSFIRGLSLKLGSDKYDYTYLLMKLSTIYKWERDLCKDILMIMPKSCFEYSELSTFLDSNCIGTKDMTMYLLMKHFSEMFDEERLKEVEKSTNIEVNTLAKELLFKIEIKDAEAGKKSEDFIKEYFS